MVAGFHSFHWHGCALDDELARAHTELMDPAGESAYLRAFRTLLHSGRPAATGIALDHFQYSGALTRFGGQSAVERFAPEVLAIARASLRQPPAPAAGDTFEGANHASALNAMMNLAEPADAELIVAALERATNGNVIDAACAAARTALYECAEPDTRLVAALGAVAFDENLDLVVREGALSALFYTGGAEATGLLVRATESGELRLQAEGALGLTVRHRFHAHRERLERLVATWPEDAGYRGSEVREALTGFHSLHWEGAEPDDRRLRDAHLELMFPTTDAAYQSAFRALLHSDDTVAVGIALDHFESWEGTCRILDPDVVEGLRPEVLARARDLLRQPPSPLERSPRSGAAANHMSALNAIGEAGAAGSDADVVVEILDQAEAEPVVEKALWVAKGVLGASAAPDPRLIDAIVRQVYAGHPDTALRVLGEELGPEADELLLRAVRADDRDVQVHAAWQLSGRGRIDRHRGLLEELVEGWPPSLTSPDSQARRVRERVLKGH
jgi:hypothetical protein